MIAKAGGCSTVEQIEARIALYGGMCAYCGIRPYEHLDHAIPLAMGGTNWPANIRPSCAPCNLSKNKKAWALVCFGGSSFGGRFAWWDWEIRVARPPSWIDPSSDMSDRERVRREYYESVENKKMLELLDRFAKRFNVPALETCRLCPDCGALTDYDFVFDRNECPNGCFLQAPRRLSVAEYDRRSVIALNEEFL